MSYPDWDSSTMQEQENGPGQSGGDPWVDSDKWAQHIKDLPCRKKLRQGRFYNKINSIVNINFMLNQKTNFYYWLQIVAAWNDFDKQTGIFYFYNSSIKNISIFEKNILEKIRQILQKNPNPRKILAELYSGKIKSKSAQKIAEIAEPLEKVFAKFWQNHSPNLENFTQRIPIKNLEKLTPLCEKVIKFYRSDFKISQKVNVFLVINDKNLASQGLRISDTNFILIAPKISQNLSAQRDFVEKLFHEIFHWIEQKSPITRKIIFNSYQKILEPAQLPARPNYNWRQMYTEAMTYALANAPSSKIISEFIGEKTTKNTSELKRIFLNFVNKMPEGAKIADFYLAEFVGILIEEKFCEYLFSGKEFNEKLADEISQLYKKFGEL